MFNRITAANLTEAATIARAKVAGNRPWLNAIDSALSMLSTGLWRWDGETLVIASRSNPGHGHTVTHTTCTCTANANGRPCWHRAARQLLVRAMEIAAQPAPVAAPKSDKAAAMREAAELFA
jgi:hypothetical protein